MAQHSLADLAVQTLAALRALDELTGNERPERHQVRQIKRLAEANLEAAFRQATELAWMAKDLGSLVAEVQAESAQQAIAGGGE